MPQRRFIARRSPGDSMSTPRIYLFSFCISLVICIVALSACSATLATSGPSHLQASNAINTVWAGVYTPAQAETGEASYRSKCASCHGRNLEGDDDFCTLPLTGAEFWKRWGGLSVGALYEKIHRTMPENQPGSLSGDEAAAVVSFLLKANQLPAGQKDLPSEVSALNRIIMTNHGPKH